MPVEIEEMIVRATVQPEVPTTSPASHARIAAQISASLRDEVARLQYDDERTRAVGNDA
jgi:hypothetical protein